MAGDSEAAVSRSRISSHPQGRGNTESPSRNSQSAALQGATLAFNNNAHPPKPVVHESRGAPRSPRRAGSPSGSRNNGHISPESSPERYVGSVKDRIRKFTDNHGSTDTLRVPGNDAMKRSESPQWIAAQLAAGRSATNSPGPPPPPAKRSNGLEGTKARHQNTNYPYPRDNISSTSVHNTSDRKPVQPTSTRNRAVGSAENSEDEISSTNTGITGNSGPISSRTPPPRYPANESGKLAGEKPIIQGGTAARSPGDPSKPPRRHLDSTPARRDEQLLSPKLTPGELLSPSPKRHTDQSPSLKERKPPLPTRTNTSNSNTSFSSLAIPSKKPTDGTRSTTSYSPTRPAVVAESTLSRMRSQNHSNTSLKPQNTGMSDDSMANAIAASSLASSRAPSPSRNQPPPPPPKRRTRSRSMLHPHGSKTDDSRTPSPAKGLRETMRTHSKSDDEEENTKKQRRKRIIKTHPHKHNEGDRKRWRDQISEKERKRYDGVWAANRGLWVSSPGTPSGSTRPAGSNKVLNLVVREIWSRTRLPASVLEQVWNLVDRQADGMLARDEFVVGMWLIDQRLKGRKLPVKVSASVWESVRQLSDPNMASLRLLG